MVAKGAKDGYGDEEKELPFTAPTNMGGTAGTYTVTFTYDSNGKITNVTAAIPTPQNH